MSPRPRDLLRGLRKPSRAEKQERSAVEAARRVQKELYLLHLLQTARYADPRHLAHFEAQVFSEGGEDGVIAEIFRRIGVTNQFFVDIGAGHGIPSNTAYLLRKGWRGVWVEANPRALRSIHAQFASVLESGQLAIAHAFVTRDTVSALLQRAQVPSDFDFLSLDVDRNTSHVWRGLAGFRPRAIAIEYNAAIPAADAWEVPYDANAMWDGSSYYGASLKALEQLGAERGYRLVGCDLAGQNAFFVRADAAADHFAGPFSAEARHEPPRYFLNREWGHVRRFEEQRRGPRRHWPGADA